MKDILLELVKNYLECAYIFAVFCTLMDVISTILHFIIKYRKELLEYIRNKEYRKVASYIFNCVDYVIAVKNTIKYFIFMIAFEIVVGSIFLMTYSAIARSLF